MKPFIRNICWFIFVGLISFAFVVQLHAQPSTGRDGQVGDSKGSFQLYPKNVVVTPKTSIQFCALLMKDGYARTPAGLRWHGSEGTINATGCYEAPAKAGTYVVKAFLGDQSRASAQVIVRTADTKTNEPKSAAKISIIKCDIKTPNFMTMKLSATVKVTGKKAHRLLLYVIDTKGHSKQLCSKDVLDGSTVALKAKYSSIGTKKLSYILQDEHKRTIAKLSRRVH